MLHGVGILWLKLLKNHMCISADSETTLRPPPITDLTVLGKCLTCTFMNITTHQFYAIETCLITIIK